jgi:hypothetical protein
MLSINAHTQNWQERELAAWQESAESFHFDAGAYGGIAICSLFFVGIVAGLLEVHFFKTSPSVGVYTFVSGIVALFALFVLEVFGEIALDIYKNRSVY